MAQDRLSIARGTVPFVTVVVQKQRASISEQQMEFDSRRVEKEKRIEALMSDLQKVSAGLDAR
jgi:hypothetical protein